MFDDTFIVDILAKIWVEVFTTLHLNTENIYKYHDFRERGKQNVPSVVIRKLNGSTIVEGTSTGYKEYRNQAHNRHLLRIWQRQVNIEMVLRGYIKNEGNQDNIYTARLYSLFLREFENHGNVIDCGTELPSDTEIDITRPCSILSFNERKSIIEEQDNFLIETLTVETPVLFYEYYRLI